MLFILLSALYFTDTFLRASLKTFWMDELFTVYLCRLPSFHATWMAVMHGTDFNPPLFYLVTRWAEYLFGEGLIATRLPSILGFWVYGISLYLFVARRLNRTAGAIAALFPFFTLAYPYAYEARAHGMVLAWCGLMLLSWQQAHERPQLSLWLGGLFLSFLAALLTHIYAVYLLVPYLLVEAYDLFHRKRAHIGVLLALLLPPVCVLPMYLRLVHAYKNLTSLGGIPARLFEFTQQHLIAVFGPSLIVLLILLVLLAWERRNPDRNAATGPSLSLLPCEFVLAVGFVLLPFLGIATVRFTHGPFFDRYFLSATAGYAILLAQGTVFRQRRNFVGAGMLIAMIIPLLASTMMAARYHLRHSYGGQVELSSHFVFSDDATRPLSPYSSLLRANRSLDILVTAEPVYLYLYYYAPPELRRRLVFAAGDNDDVFMKAYGRLAATGVDLRTATFSESFATHKNLLVYSSSDGLLNGGCYDCLDNFLEAGYTLRSVDRDEHNLLEHFSR